MFTSIVQESIIIPPTYGFSNSKDKQWSTSNSDHWDDVYGTDLFS